MLQLPLTSEEAIAVDEIQVIGDWHFDEGFQIIDTPGWGHNPVQSEGLQSLLATTDIVAEVSPRIASINKWIFGANSCRQGRTQKAT